MQPAVILSKREQEYLLRIIEAAHQVRDWSALFLLAQGQLQALLPHEVLVCMQFDQHGALARIECLHACALIESERQRLCDPGDGLALRMARGMPPEDGNALAASTGQVQGACTSIALFGMGLRPNARHAYFLDLLLPSLHMTLSRLVWPAPSIGRAARALSAREAEILQWVRAGKSNQDIASIVGLSPLTVKNHLQRIYRVLGVANRTQAALIQ